MIVTIRHKGLRRLFERDDGRGVRGDMMDRLVKMLTVLNRLEEIDELDVYPGWRAHQLKGKLAGYWSLSVSGNWRLIFRLKGGDIHDLDLVDYH